jgi:chaperone required for assembly of F1-ATPase
MAEQDGLNEQELKRLYYERLCDWSEPGAVKVYRDGRLLGTPAGMRMTSAITRAAALSSIVVPKN